MQPALITFDAYAALCDYRASLLPLVETIPGLDRVQASEFLDLWRTRQLAVAALSNALQGERISFRACTSFALDYVLQRHALAADAPMREQLISAWYPLTPWPEADEVLAGLAARGYPLAILSNGDQDMLEALAAQFATPFQHIFSSEQCGWYKPHPGVYAIPTKTLGVEHYLHVAGSANDAIGATAAGISCYWSNRQNDCVIMPHYAPRHQGLDLRGILDIV